MKLNSRFNPLRPLQNPRGIALMVALFALMLLIFVAVEVSYDTNVEYAVARQQVNRLKAYYAARSGVEISLLRIALYKKAVAALGDTLGQNISMLDPIWQIPFTWPPVVPDNVSGVDKSQIEDAVKGSALDGQYLATIQAEGNRIDINDLGSASEALAKAIRAQLLKMFISEVERNEEFARLYRDFRFEELINNLSDWVDPDDESRNGGSEKDAYRDVISVDNDARDRLPPNQPFKTMKELNMVALMDEGLYQFLLPRVTIFGTKGINVNYATADVLAALDPTMNQEAIEAVIARRSNLQDGGPFKDEADFFGFIQRFGVDSASIEKSGVPLVFGVEFNFRVQADGLYGNVKRSITAITFDIENVKERYLKIIEKEDQPDDNSQPPGRDGGPAPDEKVKFKATKGRPTVVYWEET